MNNELGKALECIFNTITAKSDKDMMELLGESMVAIEKSNYNLDNPEKFNIFINHKLNRAIKILASNLHAPSVCRDSNKPNFIFINYSFLENNVRALCELREGSSCCADKSRHILKMFLQYSITGEIPTFNPDIENYWSPNFGDNQMWIELCDGLYELYYGKTEKYLKAYNALLHCEIRKYKHLYHTWYLELNDGDIVEVGQSYDDRLECPVLKSEEQKCYILHKRLVKDKEFELYEPNNEEDCFLLGTKYFKIPYSSVKSVYYETEEKMV